MIKSFNDFILESKTSLLKENSHAETPAVYCGTYGKYANGSIEGEWVNLTDFDTYEEFMDNYTADDTEDLYEYAKKHDAIIKIKHMED